MAKLTKLVWKLKPGFPYGGSGRRAHSCEPCVLMSSLQACLFQIKVLMTLWIVALLFWSAWDVGSCEVTAGLNSFPQRVRVPPFSFPGLRAGRHPFQIYLQRRNRFITESLARLFIIYLCCFSRVKHRLPPLTFTVLPRLDLWLHGKTRAHVIAYNNPPPHPTTSPSRSRSSFYHPAPSRRLYVWVFLDVDRWSWSSKLECQRSERQHVEVL